MILYLFGLILIAKKNVAKATFFITIFCFSALNTFSQGLQSDSLSINYLPSIPFLPNPLMINKGGNDIPITTIRQWGRKRQWIKNEYQHWISGTIPPPPKTFHIKILSDFINKSGVELRKVELSFGPEYKAKMAVELMIPPAKRPLPVLMTQGYQRAWARIAVTRGYIGCIYAAADGDDDTKDYSQIYPKYSFATLMKRAWGCSRVIDYLYTLPMVDTNCIALTGHSRNGKQSLMAAAFDNRIKAVVSSSGGTGGEMTFRYSDDRFNSESVEEITHNFPGWFSPRLHLFAGREEKLPVDQNSLMSLIAPRGLMIVSSISEDQGNPWGAEQSYKSVKTVYHFLHADSKVAILLRRGRHQHSQRDIENYLDFFDYIFGRSKIAPQNKLYYDYSFGKWEKLSGEKIDPFKFPKYEGYNYSWEKVPDENALVKKQDKERRKIQWLLGKEPPIVLTNRDYSAYLNGNNEYGDDYLSEVIGQVHFPKEDDIKVMRIGPYHSLAGNLWGTIFFPPGSVKDTGSIKKFNNSVIKNLPVVSKKLPLVIFLHGYYYATGYRRRATGLIQHFLKAGYAVLGFDLMGFGTRVEEALRFYNRYPHWSELGDMVSDTRGVVSDAYHWMPFIDSSNIYLVGYSLGGTVALFTAALDQHVKGVASVCGFSSFRNDNVGTEGIRHFYKITGLIPKLGLFKGNENRIPVDFAGILSCIAPRPLFIIAPRFDRDHSIAEVNSTLSIVRNVYESAHKSHSLIIQEPNTYNHFTNGMQVQIADWLLKQRNNNLKLNPN